MRGYCDYCGCEQDFQELSGAQSAVLWGNSHAELWENSHAELRENSHAVLWENSHAVLWGNSHAVLWGNSHAVLWENSHAQCSSPYACGILKSITASCSGRHIGEQPIPPEEYLEMCGIKVKSGEVILYKSVNKNLTNGRDGSFQYVIGQEAIALDWNPKYKDECGCGLHLSPTVGQAKSFHDTLTYLACRVKVKDIASLPAFAEYPDKIRVRACVPLYLVDENGKKIKAVKESKDVKA